jgi:hypothetical protein
VKASVLKEKLVVEVNAFLKKKWNVIPQVPAKNGVRKLVPVFANVQEKQIVVRHPILVVLRVRKTKYGIPQVVPVQRCAKTDKPTARRKMFV